jgi:hypothetical protein
MVRKGFLVLRQIGAFRGLLRAKRIRARAAARQWKLVVLFCSAPIGQTPTQLLCCHLFPRLLRSALSSRDRKDHYRSSCAFRGYASLLDDE